MHLTRASIAQYSLSLQIKCEELKLDNLTILPSVPQLERIRASCCCFIFSNIRCRQQTSTAPQAHKLRAGAQNLFAKALEQFQNKTFSKKTKLFLLNGPEVVMENCPQGSDKPDHQRVANMSPQQGGNAAHGFFISLHRRKWHGQPLALLG